MVWFIDDNEDRLVADGGEVVTVSVVSPVAAVAFWELLPANGQNLCGGLPCGLAFFALACSGLPASSIGCKILLRAFINLYKK
jgi:hypothetical protein